ncbi:MULTISPECIES: hypothetical protein [unclassified Arcicella]|uniref:hypothetical protein n=1 Tax=unclassified Arcicella TaxID=2644986 RepID=UPI0028600CC9|nr:MULTISPECIES: hypothetical protein [unclassified Arcicella]MDR6563265.1 hypothetical protein [Arcicella sp. BE51]MDR6811584.1 hypothetical protein [Arcicella sp. BE140]MDR6823110.1 hypothetical protein [Arcicella sp. BE139]
MSNWNTIHFFNDKIFHSEIIPDLRGNGVILSFYFNSKLGQYILGDNTNSKQRIDKIIAFCNGFNDHFNFHEARYTIQTRQKKITEDYSIFVDSKLKDDRDFIRKYGQEIEDLSAILTLIIFSECAVYNPHLILHSGYFTAKNGSIAEECCEKIIRSETSGVFDYFGSGIINWLTHENLRLLELDKENLHLTNEEDDDYPNEFLSFSQLAIDNSCGLLTVSNVNERVIKMIEKPKLSIVLDRDNLKYEYIIWNE